MTRHFRSCAAGIALSALAAGGSAVGAQSVRPYRPDVDVLDYAFALTLPDSGGAIEAEATVRFARTAPTDTLVLDLVGLRVSEVRVAGEAVAFGRDSATVRIPLPRREPGVARAGDTLVAVVRYAGTPTDGLIVAIDSVGRWTAFGDNWPDRARHWLPTVDHPSDKATVAWTVSAPRGRTVVANGVMLGAEDALGGRRVTRWRESRPIAPYLMVIAAAPMTRVDLGATACGLARDGGCVPQAVYAEPEARRFLPGAFRDAGEIVRWFSTLVAPFPYEKLAHVQSASRFGGMENASAIFYAHSTFLRGTPDRGLIAHETAHQWFGDAVTEREWAHVWLSEGFATYWAALETRHADGERAFRDEMRRLRSEITASSVSAERPVIDTAERQYLKLLNTNSYQKGAWTLHMLRALVGDSAFFRGVRAYYVAHHDDTALSDDLRQALEASAGRPLDWFFDQWLRRPGFAELTTSWRWDRAARRVRLTVTQGERFAPYRFPLDVNVVGADGATRRVTVEVPAEREVTLTLDGPLTATLTSKPRAVRVDPDVKLLATIREKGG